MDMSNEHLHGYIADYTEGTMPIDLVPIFEQFLRLNPDIARFTTQAAKGREWLRRYGNRLIGKQLA